MWFIAAYVIYFSYYITQNIGTACNTTGMKISPWIFPMMLSSNINILYLVLPIIILFCDAPFLDNTQPYIIVRSKRTVWALGQMIYIAVSSFIYSLFLMIMSVIVNLGHMEFTSQWGSFIRDPFVNNYLNENPRGYFFVVDHIVKYFTPLQAMWFTFLFLWLVGILLGLLMFCLNSVSGSRILGAFCATFLLVWIQGVGWLSEWFVRLSPVSWVDLTNISISGEPPALPSYTYVMTFYIGAIVLLSAVILITNRKRSKEIQGRNRFKQREH